MSLPNRWRLIDRPLRTQFLIAAGWVVLWFGATSWLQGALLERQADASRSLLRAHSAVSGLILLQRDFYRQQSAVFGYLETREERFLSYVNSGKALWRERAGALTELGRYEALQARYGDWEALTSGFIEDQARRRRNLSLADAEREAALSREIFATIESLVEAENREAARWGLRERLARKASFVAMLVSSFALLAFLGYLLSRLYRSIARPVASLSASMARYQRGELGTRVEVTSRSEIGHLQASFNESAEKIEEMVRDLRKLDELKNDFLSTVSHELKTPLTSIGGFTRLLIQGDAGPVNETQKEFLGIVETNVKRLSELIGDLLDMERMQSGRIPLARERIDLRGILEECQRTLQMLAAEKGLAFSVALPDREIVVSGDRARLVQVFMNLFSNAVKYTQAGSVSVAVEPQSYAVVVKVKDTGLGIPEEEQGRLFEKFYRAPSVRESAEGGTGLGLVIAKSLIEAHGGRISVRSRPGEGSVFTVILPLDLSGAAVAGSVPGGDHESGVRSIMKEIWVVDPDGAHVEAMEASLNRVAPSLDFLPVLRVFRSARELPTRGSNPALIAWARTGGAETGPIPILAPMIQVGKGFDHDPMSSRPEDFGIAVRRVIGRSSKRVLVADSSEEVREQVRRSLEARGYRVDEVGAGGALLKRLSRDRYDLIVVDPELGDMKATELMRSIRSDSRGKDIPVFVLLNEKGSSSSRQGLIRLGADQFVGKVGGMGGVADAVTDFLEGGRP